MEHTNLLQQSTLVVQEKVTIFANTYSLFDADGRPVGSLQEHRSIWRFLVKRNFAPFRITCFDAQGHPLATMSKGWAFLAPRYTITDNNGHTLALIRSKVTLIKPKADLLDANGNLLGSLEGNWVCWDFNITSPEGHTLASINKEFSGVLKELFTTADKYRVSLSPNVRDPKLRMAIIFTASAIDLILKEQQ